MSDSDELDIDGGESPEISTTKKKKGGLAALLPTILKFAAIGIGAIIFIVTVSVITINIVNRGGRSQTVVTDPSSPYIGSRPIYSWYSDIGAITTRTRDVTSHTVTVVINLAYDQGDTTASSELNGRRIELQGFVRRFFAGKYASELQPENEARIKREIIEQLNTRILSTTKIRDIEFTRLDVMETSF